MSRRRVRSAGYRLRRAQRWIQKQIERELVKLLQHQGPISYDTAGYQLVMDNVNNTLERIGGRMELERLLAEYLARITAS